MAEELQILLLGGLRVTRGTTPVTGFVSAKAQALLAYLATTGRPHSREALAALLWGEVGDAAAAHSLRHVLSNLRKLVGAHLSITRQTVSFSHAAPVFVDVERFQAQLHQPAASVERLETAMALYQGDFLDGFSVRDAPAFEEWAIGQRERLRQAAFHGLHELATHYLAQHDDARGIDVLARVLQLDPWREATHRQLMLLLAQSGQRDAALRQYQLCRRVLAEELGVEPEDETTALAEQIRAGAVAVQSPRLARRHNIPVQPTLLLGRDDDLARLRQLLRPEARPASGRLVTLVGPGGVGKTRLALEVASQVIEDFAHGVFFVPLAPIRDPGLVPVTIARALDVQQSHGRPVLQNVLDYLRSRHLMLLIDNFEQVAEAAPMLAELAAACPRLMIVVTSRAALCLSGEHQYQVAPLALPDAGDVPEPATLNTYASVALFVERAQQVNSAFALTPATAAAVAAICRRLDGLPLAIELAAARSKLLPPQALLARLDRPLDLVTARALDRPERQQTLRATIAWSYDLLTPAEQRLFTRLGIFVGGFMLEAAEAVCGRGRGAEGQGAVGNILDGVASLLDKSLLRQMTEAHGEARLTMLETIREYALEQLAASGEAESIAHRHAAFFLRIAEAAAPHLMDEQQRLWLDRLEADHDNMRAALRWSLEHNAAELALRLCGALWRFWYAHSHIAEGRRWTEAALAHNESDDRIARVYVARALHGAGVLANYGGDRSCARTRLQQALALLRVEDDRAGVAAVLHELGGVAQVEGNYQAAIELYQESLEIFRATANRAGIALSLYRLGSVELAAGDCERGKALCEESMVLFRELGDTGSIAAALNSLGMAEQQTGNYARAAALFEQGLALYRELGNQHGVGWATGNLGYLAWAQGDYRSAAAWFEQNLSRSRADGDHAVAENVRLLGNLALDAGDEARAGALLCESLELCGKVGYAPGVAGALEGLAALASSRTWPGDGEARGRRAARLWGAAMAIRRAAHAPLPEPERDAHERRVAQGRTLLPDTAWKEAWADGACMTIDQAISYGLRRCQLPGM